MTIGTQSWHERLWRTNNLADIARNLVPGAKAFSAFGERETSGPETDSVIWETGMPAMFTVPNSISLTVVSSDVDTRRLKMVYLDADLVQRVETVTLNGTTPVVTTAADIRFVNNLYSLDGPAATTVTLTDNDTTYAILRPGDVQFNQAMYRVPAGKRLMVTSLFAGAVSGTSASKVVVKAEVSFFNGDHFAEDGILHPIGAIAVQDNAVTLPFGPFPIPEGEIVALTFKCDKAADVVGGMFGWTETA